MVSAKVSSTLFKWYRQRFLVLCSNGIGKGFYKLVQMVSAKGSNSLYR